jgi:hypothetical protein
LDSAETRASIRLIARPGIGFTHRGGTIDQADRRRTGWPRPTSALRVGGNRDVVTYISRAELATWLGYLAVSFW